MTLTPSLDFSRVGLCDRGEELQLLNKAAEAAFEQRKASVVWIEGEGGTGKSRLVKTFKESLTRKIDKNEFFFCQGKFDEGDTEPLSAVVHALDDLVERLLVSAEWKEKILNGCDTFALSCLLPSFAKVLTESNPALKQQASTDFARIRSAVRFFFRLVSSETKVFLTLDDLQWADKESLGVIETLVDDIQFQGMFLFVGSFRPLDEMHPLREKIASDPGRQTVESDQGRSFITLSNLTVKGTADLLASLLRKGSEEVLPLAEVVHAKTGGNAFFMEHFIRLLEDRSMLVFSLSSYQWAWNIERIQADTDISNSNVVDMIVDKIRKMPELHQRALVRTSCLGVSQFEFETFRCIMSSESDNATGTMPQDLSDALEKLVDEGFFEKLSLSRYKFAHDRIREGSYSLWSDDEARKRTHYEIGRSLNKLRSNLDDQSREYNDIIFPTVFQLNQSSEFLADEAERVGLAKLNHEAAEYAARRSAFYPASSFLSAARDHLGNSPWVDHYDLMLKLVSRQARIQYCCGRIRESLEAAEEVLTNARRLDDKVDAYKIRIRSLYLSGRGLEAAHICLNLLDALGERFPRSQLRRHLIREEKAVWRRLGKMSEEEISNLPSREIDQKRESIANIIEVLGEVALSSGKFLTEYLYICFSRLMLYTLNAGRVPCTSSSFVYWGWYLASKGDFKGSLRFGKIGMRYAAEKKSVVHDPRTVNCFYYFVFHWGIPYQNGVEPSSKSIKEMWDAGQVEIVHQNMTCYFRVYFCSGLKLGPLEKDIVRFMDLMKEYPTDHAYNGYRPFYQMIDNLVGRSEDPLVLTGEYMDQLACEQDWEARGNQKGLHRICLHRLILAAYFADFELVVELSEKIGPPIIEGPTVWLPYIYFFVGLAHTILANRTGKFKHRFKSNAIIRLLSKWVSAGNFNCHHMLLLVLAERLSGRSRDVIAVGRAFDDAIIAAGRPGFINNQALANERAGDCFLRRGDKRSASQYLNRAYVLYENWGALGKVQQMEQLYASLLGAFSVRWGGSTTFNARPRLSYISVEQHQSLPGVAASIHKSSFLDKS